MSLATALHNYNPTVTKEERELANERRRWLAYERIHKVWQKLKTIRAGYISLTEIAQGAGAHLRTAKQALSYSFNDISWQLRKAFINCSYRVTKKKEILDRPKPTRKQLAELKTRQMKESVAWQAEINRTKAKQGDGVSIRMTGRQAASFYKRQQAPGQWAETKLKLKRLLTFKKKGFKMEEEREQKQEKFRPSNGEAYQVFKNRPKDHRDYEAERQADREVQNRMREIREQGRQEPSGPKPDFDALRRQAAQVAQNHRAMLGARQAEYQERSRKHVPSIRI